MLIEDRKADLMRKISINGKDLFCDMIHEIYSPVIDGWSTIEVVLKESADAPDLLRFMTKQTFPEDEDYFVGQIGKNRANIRFEKDCAFRIYKVKGEGTK